MNAPTPKERGRPARNLIILAAWLAAAPAPAAPATSAAAPAPAAKVGDTAVPADELKQFFVTLEPAEREALGRDPARLNQVVRTLLAQRLVLEQALAEKWDQRPELAAKLRTARDKVIVEEFLRARSTVAEGFPSEAELRAAYESNKSALFVPRQFRLAQIYLASSPDAGKQAATKGKLEAVRKSLAAPDADFAAIARSQSDDAATAAKGGEIGWLAETQIQPAIRDRVVELKINQISEPVQLDDGWHVMKLLEIKDARTASFDEVRQQLAARMRAERSRLASQQYLAGLLDQHPVAINELALTEMLKEMDQ
jgi:peptidylprolyl isomerase